MIEAGLAFAAGLFLTWPALVAFMLLGIIFEHSGARGWSVFVALVTAVTSYFFFAVPLSTLAIGTAAYIVIGVVWSFWRYKRHVDSAVTEAKKENSAVRELILQSIHPKVMLPTISAWVIIWPFSFIENILGDLITVLETFIMKIFRGVYYRYYNSAVEALK